MVRFGVIGTNWITDAFLQAAKQVEGFALTAVYSRTEEKAKEFAAKHGASHAFTDMEAMAASGAIDAVYIATPNSHHEEHATLCMNRGIHVLCEKPLASNAAEIRRMAESAKRNGVLLMEAMKTTLLPNFQAIIDNLPKIGKVRRYFANYGQYSSRYDAYRAGTVLNAFNPAYSNGALMDLGIYCVYPAIVLFGKPSEVKANGVLLESGVDGEGSLLLKYEGMEGVLQYSKISNSYVPSEIQGEEGSLLIDKISTPEKVEIRYRDGRTEEVSVPQHADNMMYELQEFLRLIEAGELESKINSHANSLSSMEVMDEARRQMGLVYPADQRS
ncbi:Gfo/Idh/MocA family protein [Cohnella thailandensis]|uniref:Gfo/Idh/MocA family oxidoreductase n=1 Tax=Cohnella thailandensis TaxID=557557 RepID=A0A841TAF4_9BACL|nr:Gfo/Idh/MocA family oxidoreductase [Cohnella thailandensis]MBB6638201.1 Gfo/Idh/MocA family oxidoreductase [Cohnella thailandensis]MBP1977759.1 putative dehydrogenase [Cohnella thailandensis]